MRELNMNAWAAASPDAAGEFRTGPFRNASSLPEMRVFFVA